MRNSLPHSLYYRKLKGEIPAIPNVTNVTFTKSTREEFKYMCALKGFVSCCLTLL